jgi:hypothetical protein
MQLLIHGPEVHIPAQDTQTTRCGTATDTTWHVEDVELSVFTQRVTCPECVKRLGLLNLHYASRGQREVFRGYR